MAVSIGQPLESTIETNGTAYSFDEDPPDMPGLKKSNERFRLPHITDLFPDIVPKYSTFSTKSSCLIRGNVQGPLRAKELGKMFVDDRDRVLLKVIRYAHASSSGAECLNDDCTFEHWWLSRAGPRSHIYFEPTEVNAAIVTCGGLCPGLNDVIRQIALTLTTYGVTDVKGIAYGYKGFIDEKIRDIDLTPQSVATIHLMGGSILGSSRGNSKTSEIVDNIEKRGTNMLFVIGGNGSHAGAMAIHQECFKRKLKVAVVGVPKTIDNDILLMDKTFGFDTAVEEAQRAIKAAYIEAASAYHGVGVVKLMGRQSGFIAMYASLASGQVDCCLIPEVHFSLDGPNGVYEHMKTVINRKGHCLVVIAEGAGQDLVAGEGGTDASGNPILADIGQWFVKQAKKHFKEVGFPAEFKYIDPTYMIRATPANASDGILCSVLGQNAVHAAFGGYTGVTVGLVNTHYCLLPIPEVIREARNVDPDSRMWHRCLTSTGQPDFSPPHVESN
ncbi:Pyrophosphate-dependent phosphofructo-1-kinase [Klebsormidium nitens]|uniref:ATP-dependent 6-phosphofructokinase n=1 Tax=Klebsormidium nitens TaxID=105231 RepID=A0A1Y1HV60_KLENI|nr:Pyrophosphate-dependent phosphofructo-1-kinase [Klebsormidium nitens]|eukprot:GAQ80861.1 Pyrophosphate-dependent phosphofructo-1-kinase [Klebsormidium nitens]